MSLDTGLLSFSALTSLALAMPRHRRDFALGRAPSTWMARLLGVALLVLAPTTAIVRLGLGFGMVAWIGQLGVAGGLLVLLMSWRPAAAPAVACVTLACAALLVA